MVDGDVTHDAFFGLGDVVTSRALSGEAFRPIWGETQGGVPHRSRRITVLDRCGMRLA
jgi:hypothetical protein